MGDILSNLHAYLKRIEYPGHDQHQQQLPLPTLETLTTLHRQHRICIPFEDLIFVHHTLKGTERPVDLDSLYKRMVYRRRGGMCQEQNVLLFHNLRTLGYECYQGMAAVVVAGSQQPAAEPFEGLVSSRNLGRTQNFGTHQVILTQVDGLWYLTDVGFGGHGIVEPLLLRAYDDTDSSGPAGQLPPADWAAAGGEFEQLGAKYRLRWGIMGSAEPLPAADVNSHPERHSFVGYYMQAQLHGEWVDQYWFSRVPTTQQVLAATAEYAFRTHPLFTQHMVVVRALPDGQASMLDFVLKIRRVGQQTEVRQLQSEQERDEVLQSVFGLDLSPVDTGYPLAADSKQAGAAVGGGMNGGHA